MVIERHGGAGSEMAFMQQTALLASHGHEVAHFTLDEHALTTCAAQHHYFAPPNLRSLLWGKLPAKLLNRLYAVEKRMVFRKQAILKHFKQAIADFQPDIVHFHTVGELKTPEMFAVPKAMGIPNVLTLHLSWAACPAEHLLKGGCTPCDGICAQEASAGASCHTFGCIPNPLSRFFNVREFRRMVQHNTLSQCFDHILTPSQAMADLMIHTRQMPAERLSVVYNATHPALLAITPEASKLPEKTFFLAPTRLRTYKGIWLLLETFSQLPDIPLVLVGDGPEKQAVKNYISRHGLHHVRLIEWQSGEDLWQLYRACYAVIIPSLLFEALGLVIAEGFAHGKPAIGSRRGGIPELIRHNETGLLFDPDRPEALLNAVRTLWENPEKAWQWGENGYHLFHRLFDPASIYAGHLEAFQAAIRYQQQQRPTTQPV